MGVAIAYDAFEDVGMAFSDEQVASFVPSAWAEGRVKELLHQVLVIEKYLSIPNAAKEQWWRKTQAKLIDVVTWYCQVAVIPGIDRSVVRVLPSASSSEGKALAVSAHQLADSGAWMSAWLAELAQEMRCFVTLSRRCASAVRISGWKKHDKSVANKIANAIKREIDVAEEAAIRLSSLTV